MPTEIKTNILQPIQTHSNVWAYNDNYYTFSAIESDSGDYAIITYEDLEYTLYPDVNGLFTFNTYEFSRELFNYKDTFTYQTSSIDHNQFRFIEFNIEVYLLDETTETQALNVVFYNGVVQRWNTPNVLEYTNPITKPIYFEGYPFDYSVVTEDYVFRTLPTDLNVLNVVESECEGVYLKYHNGKSGYEYYLFNKYAKGTYKTSSYGSIKEKYSWTQNTLEIGKKGQRKTLAYAVVDYEYREMMYNLADSNEVYLYTGNKGDIDALLLQEGIGIDVIGTAPIGVDYEDVEGFDVSNQWLEVKVDLTVSETNLETAFEQDITILLPESQTRTRI